LLAAIDKRRRLPLHKFIFAMGIRHIGKESAVLLGERYGDFKALWSDLEKNELQMIPGIGPKGIAALLDLVADEKKKAVVLELMGLIEVEKTDVVALGSDAKVESGIQAGSLKGQTVVFTGKFDLDSLSMTRKQAEDECITRGAKIGSAVTAKTTILVEASSDGEDALSTKAKKARSLGILIMTPQEFAKKFFS